MKRLFLLILCLCLLTACAPADTANDSDEIDDVKNENVETGNDGESSLAGGAVTIANPFVYYETAAEVGDVSGIYLNIPENAENAGFAVISGTIAQATFSLDSSEFTLRASKELYSTALHGIYDEADVTEDTTLDNGISVKYSSFSGKYTACEWEKDGVYYSLLKTGAADCAEMIEVVLSSAK